METASTAAGAALQQLTQRYRPQLAVPVRQPPSGPGWVHELKLDGYRVGAAVVHGEVRLVSRRANDLSGEFPEIVAAAQRVRADQALLDGEIVMLDDAGRPSFQARQNRGADRRGLTYFVFDLLRLDAEQRLPAVVGSG
jgi:bifunctional non-homologous end joining protein LigD